MATHFSRVRRQMAVRAMIPVKATYSSEGNELPLHQLLEGFSGQFGQAPSLPSAAVEIRRI